MGTILNTSENVSSDGDGGYTFPCADKSAMPSFDLLFGGYWFTVNVEDYVTVVEESICSLCIGIIEDEWILGDAFMRGWYNIHDHTNARIGFYTLDASAKSKPE